jgi:hypothetical protein
MSFLTAVAVTPFKAYLAFSLASLTLAVACRRRPEAQVLSPWLSFAAFALILLCADASQFQDYRSYIDWLRIAERRLPEHMDKGFGVIMVGLSVLSTSPWIWLTFVLLAVAGMLVWAGRLVQADLAIFFLLLLTNPRIQEFNFNSSRAALSMCALMLACVLWWSDRKKRAVLAAMLGLSLHLVIGSACMMVLLGVAALPVWVMIVIFGMGTAFQLLGIYPEALYAWPREQLTALVLLTKGTAVDEYLFESMTGGLWMRLSMWLYTSALPACGLWHYKNLDETGQRLVKSALALGGVALIFMSLVPIIARLHLLSCLLSALALARSHLAKDGQLGWLMAGILVMGAISISRNLMFISMT